MPDPVPPVSPDAPAGRPMGFALGDLAPGPAAERLAEVAVLFPDRPAEALALAEEALAVAEQGSRAEAFAMGYAGFASYLLSRHDAAADLLTRALAALEPLGDLDGRSLALSALTGVHVSLGHYDEALDLALENLRMARALGDADRVAWVHATLGNMYVELDEPGRAIEHGEAALRAFGELGAVGGQARAHTVLGGALRALGRYAESQAHHEAALRMAREEGVALTEARALDDLGWLAYDRGDHEEALASHRDALRLRGGVGNRQAQASSLIAIGRALTAMGRPHDARPALEEALGIAQEAGAEPRCAEAHDALADALEAAGDPAGAIGHLRAYQGLRESLLSAQARSRLQTVEIRAEVERARQEAELARIRTEELGAINARLEDTNEELQTTLDELRSAQGRLVQAEKLASLGRLSAGLAHEIQNPLNFVANFAALNADVATDLLTAVDRAEATGETPDRDAIREDLGSIVENARRVRDHARRAEAIVRGLMGHVRDVGGGRRPTDLHELLERAVSQVVPNGAVRVERDYADLAPVDVEAASIQRVFVNLLENARWAVEHGAAEAPTVRIETRAHPDGVEVRVEDNGLGIPADHCTRVFEPFFTTKPAGEGTGLGLSLAYDIVTEGHGGTLAVYSREGQGATFIATLPR